MAGADQDESHRRNHFIRDESDEPGKNINPALNSHGDRLLNAEKKPHRIHGQRLVAQAAPFIAPAQPFEQPPARHCKYRKSQKHEREECFSAAKIEQRAYGHGGAQAGVPSRSDDIDQYYGAGYGDRHEHEDHRADGPHAPAQESEQQQRGGRLGNQPKEDELADSKLIVAREREHSRRGQQCQIHNADGDLLPAVDCCDHAYRQRDWPCKTREPPKDTRQHDTVGCGKHQPRAGHHQRVGQPRHDIDGRCRRKRCKRTLISRRAARGIKAGCVYALYLQRAAGDGRLRSAHRWRRRRARLLRHRAQHCPPVPTQQ